jgi:hypothetical protein
MMGASAWAVRRPYVHSNSGSASAPAEAETGEVALPLGIAAVAWMKRWDMEKRMHLVCSAIERVEVPVMHAPGIDDCHARARQLGADCGINI